MSIPGLQPPPPFLPSPGHPAVPWDQWKQAFQTYMGASGASELPAEHRKAILLTCLGMEGQRIFSTLKPADLQSGFALATNPSSTGNHRFVRTAVGPLKTADLAVQQFAESFPSSVSVADRMQTAAIFPWDSTVAESVARWSALSSALAVRRVNLLYAGPDHGGQSRRITWLIGPRTWSISSSALIISAPHVCVARAPSDENALSTPRQPPSKIIWSLLGIGNCIDALSKNGTQRGPYRGSSLASILEGSLGGSFRTLMVKQ
ncbi:hypothetical protein HPB49_012194 [Dermacentor silvarum]|uniref:Uncharacterized protein n=1 Tax=Dermacentor silvarum TaxID=543639 RepID=A0ACB8DZX7_DERSI|nr:hypothetical protein HPB49_012194 [Dermacentor silvarum]